MSWHSQSLKDLLEQLETHEDGLTEQEARLRLSKYGENVLPGNDPPTLIAILIRQFKSPLIYILLVAALVSALLDHFTDTVFIAIVLLLNAILGTVQEWKAERSAAELQSMLEIQANVRRAGEEVSVAAKDLVPGDWVLLESGDRVAADLRLVDGNNLTIDESFLTGENIAPTKRVGALATQTALGDRANMAFAGSQVMSGRGVGVVVTTGTKTQVGQIASSVAFTEASKPPLLVRMEKFAHQISYFVGAAVIILGGIGLLKGMGLEDVFFFAVALAVSAIPEGLPVAMTVALSIAVRRMSKRKVIVRKLPAVEGLGSCTCIASDKTGTLTVNQQTVKTVSLMGFGRLSVGGEGLDLSGEVKPQEGELDESSKALLERLAKAGALGNEGRLRYREGGRVEPRGDAMDVALLAFAHKVGVLPDELKSSVEPVGEIPYESEQKYMAAFYRDQGQVRVALKGALETVLGFCDRMRTPEGETGVDLEAVEAEALALAADGYRVLAIAEGEVAEPPEHPASESDLPKLTLLGLAGFLDPLRPEVRDAVFKCQQAGIQVVMVTGDHPATALAIARELGIAEDEAQVATGMELDAVPVGSPEHREIVSRARVLARVTPLQKLNIVEDMIALGHFVAVTGDGVNDAPALKKANVGVAMGSGTDVAKETASIVITDDNFASIEAGVEEGRFAYDNLRKVTYLLISCGLAEVLLFTFSLLLGLPLPLTAVQILWLNLVTNGIQDVALAFEGGEPGAMKRKPRKPTEGMFNPLMIQQTLVSGFVMAVICIAAWQWLLDIGLSEAAARNQLLLLMVLCQNVHVFNVRSEYTSAFRVPLSRNWILIVGVLAAQGLHLLCMHIPLMQSVLGLEPVTMQQWVKLLYMALMMLVAMEIFKFVRAQLFDRQKDSMQAAS